MLIIVAVGAIVIIGLLGYTTAVLRAGGEDADALIELYAAEAGIAQVKERLLNGESIPPPTFEVNGLTVEVSVADPIRQAPDTPQYIDPRVDSVSGSETKFFTIDSVRPNTEIEVNWAYIPELATSTIRFFSGSNLVTTNPVVTSTSTSPNRLKVEPTVSTTYTIEFETHTTTTLESAPFSAAGDVDSSWVSASTYRDYIITSKTGDTTVTAYLRQVFNPTDPQSVTPQVHTLSWKPYE